MFLRFQLDVNLIFSFSSSFLLISLIVSIIFLLFTNKFSSRIPCWVFIRDDDGDNLLSSILWIMSHSGFVFSYVFILVLLFYHESIPWLSGGHWLSTHTEVKSTIHKYKHHNNYIWLCSLFYSLVSIYRGEVGGVSKCSGLVEQASLLSVGRDLLFWICWHLLIVNHFILFAIMICFSFS